MNKILRAMLAGSIVVSAATSSSNAQVSLLSDYQNYNSAAIGTFQGINFREAGFSTLFPIAGTNGAEFWVCSDRGVNVDCASANPAACHPTYDKLFSFPNYAPKIHRIRIQGDSIQIIRTITMKRPGGTTARGVLNPVGFGSTLAELATTDTVNDCANFLTKIADKDIWGIDPESLVVDKDGNFYISEENGPTIWKLNQNGEVVKRYTPYANLPGAQTQDVAIDTIFKTRKNNRGFESLAITPNGKLYAMIQSPLLNPSTAIGENSIVHRILEIDPATNAQRMMVYTNQGILGTGANQIRLKDWKTGDMAAVNDSTLLVIEAGIRGTNDNKRVYKININSATTVTSALYGGQSVEALDSAGLVAAGITPVKKTLLIDLVANGWPAALDKVEGIAILNDSTVALVNDNDFGQTCPAADGIAVPTTNKSHLFTFRLSGTDKLPNYNALAPTLAQGITGPSSSQAPYLVPTMSGMNFTAILTAGDKVGGYMMAGLPDGLGAYDNNDGTFTVLMNHEMPSATAGAVHAYGSRGAFVSKWVINKSNLAVISGQDLTNTVKLWNPLTSSYITYNASFPSTAAAFGRFCSADLAPVTAYFNAATGKGTEDRIFLNGEETGGEGRGMAHVATGTEAGTDYELPYLGKFSWENSVSNPRASDKTLVAGMDDATPGQVYFYQGEKKTSGNVIDKAGLSGGNLYSIAVDSLLIETNASVPNPNTHFTMINLGQVQNMTGAQLTTISDNAGVTNFLRPEDGAWDPNNPNDFYFNTTNAFNANSRLWKVHFNNLDSIMNGGTITAVLDGSEGQQMLDNMTIDNTGHILLVEDVGGNAHLGKVWQYTMATDQLVQIGSHDSTRFLNGSANFLTQDEEASGILDVQHILGSGMFLTVDQAHFAVAGDQVEGGQLLAFNNLASATSNPSMLVQGNSTTITNGDVTPATTDNTDFGSINTTTSVNKTFVIKNEGSGPLWINDMSITGADASAFTFVTAPTFPMTIAANSTQDVAVKFTAATAATFNASLKVMSNDLQNGTYSFAMKGTGVTPPPPPTAINEVKGNVADIKLYPNPTGDEATIAMQLTDAQQVVVSMFDMNGREVMPAISKRLSKGEQKMNISTKGLNSGVYFVQVASNDQTVKVRLVVQH
jgi:hypothetical protein